MNHLTDKEILDVACKHCEFSGEGTYHLRKYTGEWSIVRVVRECMELAELVKQATEPIVGADNEVVPTNKPDPEFWSHWCLVQRDHMGTAKGEGCSWCDAKEGVTE